MDHHPKLNKRLSLGDAGNNAIAALSAATVHDLPLIGEKINLPHLIYTVIQD
jgi:hypothetical protein